MSQENNPNSVQKHFAMASKTHQSFKEECDINTIMGRFRTTGFIQHQNVQTPVYGDFSNALEYMDAMNAIEHAKATFAALPARVRARCNNDPAEFIEFAEDPDNADELVELGLKNPITPREPETEKPEKPEEIPPETS